MQSFSCLARRERDVEQSILAMAKQAGKIDEDVRVNGCYFSVINVYVCLSVCGVCVSVGISWM